MADVERQQLFTADELEDMCKKRSEGYQSIKANYEAWRGNQQQKLQVETRELENELRQLKNDLADMELEDLRACEEFGELLSRPWTPGDDSSGIEEIFAEADRWNTELCRIKANRDRPVEDEKTVLLNIEKIQDKLEGLPAAYALIQEEETRRLREQLEGLWQRKSQPESSTTVSRSM